MKRRLVGLQGTLPSVFSFLNTIQQHCLAILNYMSAVRSATTENTNLCTPSPPTHYSPSHLCIRPLLTLLVSLSLLQLTHSVCYSSTNGSRFGCSLCFNDEGGQATSCSYTGGNNTSCYDICCNLGYKVYVSSSCYTPKAASSDSSVSVSTIVIIIVFSIPVVICVFLLIHACVVGISRTPAQPARAVGAARPPASAVNLADYNIDEAFPYQIDPQQTCSICLQNECHTMTLCGHGYHAQCLRAWIKKRESCPLCVSNEYNPIAVYCTGCGRSVRLDAMYSRMSSAQKALWQQSTTAKCANCLNQHQEEIQISIGEEELERYQNTAAAVRKDPPTMQSQQRVISSSNEIQDLH